MIDDWREIPLTQGLVTIVDREDYADLAQFRWFAHRHRPTGPYYASRHAGHLRETMHGRLMQPPPGFEVNHIDGNTLNNRRSNLRLATPHQSRCHRGKRRDNSTGYKGVSRHREHYRATMRVEGRQIHLGVFPDAITAALAYDAAASAYHGEFARLNFPSPRERV
jgi:hypothetical protein